MLLVLLVWLWLDIGKRTQVIRFGILDSMCSEHCQSVRIGVYPFVPANSPAVIMNKYLILSHVDYLSLQPLFNGVFHIKPRADFILSFLQLILLQVLVIFRIFVCIGPLLSKPSILTYDLDILRLLSLFIAKP